MNVNFFYYKVLLNTTLTESYIMNDNKNQANNESEIKAKINFNTEKKVIYISVLLVCLLLLKESFFERGYDIFFSIKYTYCEFGNK